MPQVSILLRRKPLWRPYHRQRPRLKGILVVKGYSRTQISRHWAVALLIVYQLLFSDGMTEVWRAFRQTA